MIEILSAEKDLGVRVEHVDPEYAVFCGADLVKDSKAFRAFSHNAALFLMPYLPRDRVKH